MGAVSETEPDALALAAAASVSMAIGCRSAARRRVCRVRALVWLEKNGWVVVGKTGEGRERDRDVGVGGEATCCRERTTRRPEDIYGEATGEGGSGTLAPVSFCFVPARSSALLCAQARQQRCNGERASSLAPATQRLEINHSFPAQHSFQLASFWLTKGELDRSQFMRFLCYATQESKAEECKGQTSMFSPRQVVRHSFFSFPITCDGRSHIFLASFSLSFVKEHVLLIFLRCNRRSIPSFFKKKRPWHFLS